MRVLTVDFETYYDKNFSLSKVTAEEYLRGDSFEAIGVSVKVDDEPAQWFSGTKARTKEFLDQFPWADSVALAHNAMFDMAILNWHFDIRPKKIADTLSMARAIHGTEVGGSLAKLVEYYQLGQKGHEVINALGKRRIDFSAEELARYGAYCCNDTELTYKLFQCMAGGFPVSELRLIDLTIRMFTEPVLGLCKQTLEAHLKGVIQTKADLMAKTAIDRDNLMSNPKLANVLRELGVEPPTKISPTTDKETYAFAKSDDGFKALLEHENVAVQHIVAARLGVKSTLEETRTERLINIANRGSLPIPLRYYAAHTGRWGGDDKVNMQNLPRTSPLKKAMLAPEGHVFIDADSSQIEARVLAWLAEQHDLVEAFANQEDVYRIMASSLYGKEPDDVTKDERFVGKTVILGCFGPDTKVLTDSGWKLIVEVQATDTLWDGEEWVSHEGVVPQGVKEVLTSRGLTATLDHEILTEHGWQEWSEVATNPSLFQSAISRANWKSCVGNNTTDQLGVLPGGTPWSAVHVVGKGALTGTISKPGALLGVMGVLKVRRQQPARSTGATKLSSPVSKTANVYSTVLQAVLDVATTQSQKLIPTMAGGVYLSTNRGGLTEELSCATSSPLTGGGTLSATSTVSIILKGMSRVISALLRVVKTLATDAPPAQCKQKSMTYDIAYAGPKNRYTVATDAGAIIVHNCGYGLGSIKLRSQLRNFGVDMDKDECDRIIEVYRQTYPAIPQLWEQAREALNAMLTGNSAQLGRHGVLDIDDIGIKLPNGLHLKYPRLRKWRNPDTGKQEMVYDTKRGKSTLIKKVYGGLVVENICQALARIIIGEQMLMVARRYRVCMTVHDAIGVVVPEHEGDKAQDFVTNCMRMRPKWADGLPLNCESKLGASYG